MHRIMRSRKSCILNVVVPSKKGSAVYITYSKRESILAIKERLEQRTGIPFHSQILSYSGYVIHDEARVEELAEANCGGIIGMNLDVAVNGGAMEPFDAPHMTSPNCFEVREFGSAPHYRAIAKGINFGGICRNNFCIAFNQSVSVELGMCGESNNICNYSEYMFELKCPGCGCFIEENEITNVIFLGCTVKIKYKIVSCARPKEFQIVAPSHNYTALKNAKEFLRYNYIKFTLK